MNDLVRNFGGDYSAFSRTVSDGHYNGDISKELLTTHVHVLLLQQ